MAVIGSLDWWPMRRCRECRRWTSAYILRWAIAFPSILPTEISARSIVTLDISFSDLFALAEGRPPAPTIYEIGPLCQICTDALILRRAHGLVGAELRRLLAEMAAR